MKKKVHAFKAEFSYFSRMLNETLVMSSGSLSDVNPGQQWNIFFLLYILYLTSILYPTSELKESSSFSSSGPPRLQEVLNGFFCSQQIPLRSVRKFLNIQFLKVRLHRLPLAPVIEDDHLLAELPLVVLHVVPVQDGESHYEGGGYCQHRDHHWTHVCWHHSEIIRNNFSSLQANAFQFRVKILFILTLLTHKVFVYISCSVSPANDWLSATRNTLHHLSSCLAVSCEAREW